MNPTIREEGERRTFEMAMDLGASPEQVWKTISDGREISRWFAPDARVTPGVGGEIWLSWGPPFEGAAKVDIWEPGRRLRWVESRPPSAEGGTPGAEPVLMYVDFTIEPRHDGAPGCTLRLVHSGFGKDAKWDDELDSISNGWKFELRSLRLYLTRHGGADRRTVYRLGSTTLTQPEALARMLGTEGLGLMHADGRPMSAGEVAGSGPGAPKPMAEGTAFTARTGYGQTLHGRVLTHNPRRAFSAVIDELNDGILRLEVERMGGACTPTFWLSVWEHAGGKERADLAFETHRAGLERVFKSLGFEQPAGSACAAG